ncbi:MAG: Hsp33 family molecular chaperone HslO [Kiritimatiellia bacterium]
MTPDLLCKGRLHGADVAFSYVHAPITVSEAVLRHHCDPAAAHILGRAIAAGLLSASTLGGRERINIRWTYGGTLKTVLVDAGPDGSVRGLITPPQLAATPDRAALTGAGGHIRVIRCADSTVTASGTTEAGLLDVVEDLNLFLCLSDQVESAMSVLIGFSDDPARPVRVCRGVLLQALPGCDLHRFHAMRQALASAPVRELLGSDREEEHLPMQIFSAVAGGEIQGSAVKISHAVAPAFRCSCNREKMGVVLGAIAVNERPAILAEGKPLSIRCHFCGQTYSVSASDCEKIWSEPG